MGGLKLLKSKVFIGLICLVIGGAGVFIIQSLSPKNTSDGPKIVEASTIFERIQAQNEMVGASQRYNITEKASNDNTMDTFLGRIHVPFTENSFWYRYVGTIKAGVNLADANFSKKDDGTIVASLPAPYIISNTPDKDASGVLEENNNILNPIHIEDIDAFMRQCVEKSESESVSNGLYDEAKKNIEKNIEGMFQAALGPDTKVTFEWR